MLLHSLLYLATLLLSAASLPQPAPPRSQCKATPNTPPTLLGLIPLPNFSPDSSSWPKSNDWLNLNNSIDGTLLRPAPPAAACHPTMMGEYDAQKCAYIQDNWNNSLWHAEHPTSSIYQNWNQWSCLPNVTAPCSAAGYPEYVVNATTAQHVEKAVQFAKNHNIRLNIKASGHDYLGRSIAPNSLSIWMRNFRSVEYHPTYTLKNCNIKLNEPAFTAGAGTFFRDLYKEVSKRDLIMVGAASWTISLGGFFTGGGHGVFTSTQGLGADNILEMEVVSPSGKLITVNECTNSDLFWAIRGGGGSTFGVVISYTMRAFASPKTTAWDGYIVGTGDSESNFDAIVHLLRIWQPKFSVNGVGAYLIGSPYSLTQRIKLTILAIDPSKPSLESLLDPVIQEISSMTSNKSSLHGNYSRTRTFGEYLFKPGVPMAVLDAEAIKEDRQFPGNGMSKINTNWLYDYESAQNSNLKQIMKDSIDRDPGSRLVINFVAGPGTENPPGIRGGGNAVNPAWRRKGIFARVATQLQWGGSRSTQQLRNLPRERDLMTYMSELKKGLPDSGAYQAEGNPQDPAYARDFFGDNYPRLLQIKRKWDPDNVFYCKTCVGSEIFMETPDRQLLCLFGAR